MKTYRVKVRVDAWVEYTVEASSKKEAVAEATAAAEFADISDAELIEVVSYEVGKVEQVKEE